MAHVLKQRARYLNVTDRHTDGQTVELLGNTALCVASRGNKRNNTL